MAQRKQSGTAYMQVDGVTVHAKGSFAVPITNTTRTPIVVGGQPIGWDETENAPYVTAQIQVTDKTDLERLVSATNQTVRVEFANEKTYTLSNAYVSGEPPEISETGEVTLTFTGEKGVWS